MNKDVLHSKVCIIGAGPAGLISAINSAQAGANTIVIESNSTAGRKLLLTGGGRCNITHKAEPAELLRNITRGKKFLRYCIYRFSPQHVLDFFEECSVQTKIEADGCVFPLSDKASQVRDALVKKAISLGVKFFYSKPAQKIAKNNDGFIITAAGATVCSEKLIITTGGLSWPKTGSTGDGFKFAGQFGHTIIKPRASLIPLITCEDWPGKIAGTDVQNAEISTKTGSKIISAKGSIIFTFDGIGGPAVLQFSSYITDYLAEIKKTLPAKIDLLTNINIEQLEKYIIEYTSSHPRKSAETILTAFLPKRLSSLLCSLSGCRNDTPAAYLQKQTRKMLISLAKGLPITIRSTRPIEEATVTRGGVCLDEIEPKTMESRLCPGLFFSGEVIDADGPCGGYNLQICWSTGSLAGISAAG